MGVVDRSFDHPLKVEERASMPLAGGINQLGYQCGMLWGAALAAGAQAYRLFGSGPQAETAAIIAAQRLVESFRAQNKHIDCLEISGIGPCAAAGDCTGGLMLAHYAAYQGELAAENIALQDKQREIGEVPVPSCIFTYPEIATVGLSEEQAQAQGCKVKVHKFDFLGSGLARIMSETEGLVKIITDESSAEVLGAAIIGPSACELIGILTLAASNHLKLSEIQKTIFAHPTLSESIGNCLKDYHAV